MSELNDTCLQRDVSQSTPQDERPIVVWFRRDLRLEDHPALHWAVQKNKPIIAVFIHDEQAAGDHTPGEASLWWLQKSLLVLNESMGKNLQVVLGDTCSSIELMIERFQPQAVCCNESHELWQRQQDLAVASLCQQHEVVFKVCEGDLLFHPDAVKNQQGLAYKVFTPYYKKGCLAQPEPSVPRSKLAQITWYESESLPGARAIQQLIAPAAWMDTLEAHWQVGEVAALKQLNHFLQHGLDEYKKGRDYPALSFVSRLSPYLHFGEISPRVVWHGAKEHMPLIPDVAQAEHFLSELGWREFSYYLLHHFPDLPDKNFQPKFDDFPWLEADPAQALPRRWENLTVSSRTDAGVHALRNTAHVDLPPNLDCPSKIVKGLNYHLPLTSPFSNPRRGLKVSYYESIPYRTPVNEGEENVLVLRTRPGRRQCPQEAGQVL